jgi:hypothetical protein
MQAGDDEFPMNFQQQGFEKTGCQPYTHIPQVVRPSPSIYGMG